MSGVQSYMVKVSCVGEPELSMKVDEPKFAQTYWHSVIEKQAWYDEDKEHLIVLLLSTRYYVKAYSLVAIGSLNESIAHPREIFRAAIATGAHAMVLLHNHPSGYPQPSAADRCLTQRLRDAADLLQIKLLDHIIVGQQRLATAANIKVSNSRRPPSSRIRAAEKPSLGDYFSFAEAGEI